MICRKGNIFAAVRSLVAASQRSKANGHQAPGSQCSSLQFRIETEFEIHFLSPEIAAIGRPQLQGPGPALIDRGSVKTIRDPR
jgi:hypothetical protein